MLNILFKKQDIGRSCDIRVPFSWWVFSSVWELNCNGLLLRRHKRFCEKHWSCFQTVLFTTKVLHRVTVHNSVFLHTKQGEPFLKEPAFVNTDNVKLPEHTSSLNWFKSTYYWTCLFFTIYHSHLLPLILFRVAGRLEPLMAFTEWETFYFPVGKAILCIYPILSVWGSGLMGSTPRFKSVPWSRAQLQEN